MKEYKLDIMEALKRSDVDAVCIPTNLTVKNNGSAVMGAGIAKLLRDKFASRQLDIRLGQNLQNGIKGVHIICDVITVDSPDAYITKWLLAFPTKNHWKDPSPIELIIQSAQQLVQFTNKEGWSRVVLTRPGCGLGGLDWETEVKPVIGPLFIPLLRTKLSSNKIKIKRG